MMPAWLAVVGGLLTFISLLAAAISFYRVATVRGTVDALRATLETVTIGNTELRKVNDDLRAELAAAHKDFARIEGQMQMLTGHLGEQIAAAVVAALPWRDPTARTRATDKKG